VPPTTLILTQTGDTHAYAVEIGLRQQGAQVLLWHTSDFPSRTTESVLFDVDGAERIWLHGVSEHDIAEKNISSVWRRRPAYILDRENLHPADRVFSDWQCRLFRSSLFDVLEPNAFWVNSPEASLRASRKILQHKLALKTGLSTPETLYSNDPRAIRAFVRRHGGAAVYKTFRAITWQDAETHWLSYTSLVSEQDLVADELLQTTPGIFQALVPKAYELRVTFIGRRFFTAKIFSQETTGGQLDWRKSYSELKMEPYVLPSAVAERCWRLMEELGIVFGCFDLIVTPEGEYVFLEVNEMGQFLFVEHWTGMPLLDAFCTFLSAGHVDYPWDSKQVQVRYQDIQQEVLALEQLYSEVHVAVPDAIVKEEEFPGEEDFSI
jgi:glutathione synthase/RimK-type ligase-like ATP-grasp enzyme